MFISHRYQTGTDIDAKMCVITDIFGLVSSVQDNCCSKGFENRARIIFDYAFQQSTIIYIQLYNEKVQIS